MGHEIVNNSTESFALPDYITNNKVKSSLRKNYRAAFLKDYVENKESLFKTWIEYDSLKKGLKYLNSFMTWYIN